MLKISFIANIILSLALAGVLVFFLSGKGINIDKRSISTSISNSYASSGSFAVGYIGGDYRGNWTVRVKSVVNDANAINDAMNELNPVQFMLTKIIIKDNTAFIYYPVTATVEDSKSKKIVNGVEVKE